jgi:hypothetical protein
MTVKEMAKDVIDKLPNETSIDEIIHALYVKSKFDQGGQEIRDGLALPQTDVK